jgi:K+-transporting ATPase ATPase C chain
MWGTVRLCLIVFAFCGLLYPLTMTGIAQVLMPEQANGSLVRNAEGVVVGSSLIGQSFHSPRYFNGRVSSIDYDGIASGSNNYAPSNEAMLQRVRDDMAAFLKANPQVQQAEIPTDLLTNSASGLDPHISPQAARIQVPRIAHERQLDPAALYALIDEHTQPRLWGIFGEARVEVLALNLALDRLHKQPLYLDEYSE